MSAPTRDAATSTTQIVVDWTALTSPNDGHAAITSYHLQWDSATSGVTWTDLVGLSVASTALTYTVTGSVTAGTTYHFRVRAQNAWGWGPFSAATSIKAATAPAQMSAVTTSIDSATGGVL